MRTIPASAPTPWQDRSLGLLGLALALCWATMLAYSAFPALPYSPVQLPGAEEMHTLAWLPQGWAFFTRNPREEKQLLYGNDGTGWTSRLLAPHARLRNAMGFDRKSRAQGVEMALLVDKAPAAAWTACRGPLPACLERLPAGAALRNRSPNPTLCGRVAIVLQPAVPWAWLHSRRPVNMPARILPLEVSC